MLGLLNRIFKIPLFLTLAASPLIFGVPQTIELSDAFSSALRNSETFLGKQEEINQAEEKYRQALGAVLPTVTAFASYQWQAAAGGGAFSPTEQPLIKVNATQPLFRGLREFAALKQTSLLSEASHQSQAVARRQLFNDVTQTFFTVLSLKQEILNLQSQMAAYERRIKELQQRIKIGRSRLTEVLTVQASLSSLKAQVYQTQGQLQIAKDTFSFITGMHDSFELSDSFPLPEKIGSLKEYQDLLLKRPEIKMRNLQLEAAEKGVSIAKGAHFPSVDVNGNYYFKRFGFFNDIPWDVGVAITLPVLNGGILSSKVEEATSLKMQAELEFKKSQRAGLQEIQSLHAAFNADLEQLKELNTARELSERNFNQQNRDYRNGLVNNLEVLQALTAFEDSKRALDRAQFQTKIDFLKLEAAVGKLPDKEQK